MSAETDATHVVLAEVDIHRELAVFDNGAYFCACREHCPSIPCNNDRDDLYTTVARIIESRERAAVAKALREAADDFIDACDWSDGRNNYGDNEGYEHSARILRARADRLEADA